MRYHCGYCGSKEHNIEYCSKTWGGQANRNALRCGYCGGRDHNADACPKKWPGPNPVQVKDRNA